MEQTVCFDKTSFLIGVLIIAFVVWKWNNDKNNKQIEIMTRISSASNDINRLTHNQAFKRLADERHYRDEVAIRDQAVLNDPLYPALGRTERPIFDNIPSRFNMPTRETSDTYRLIGYLVNKTSEDLGQNVWKLFGRQKYRGGSQGEFYVIPSHNDRKDIKIQLDDNMFIGEKIRDIYALPDKVRINNPMFSQDEYDVIQLPKSDFTSQYI